LDTQNFINFKKRRDLGSILSDTFNFLNDEWKPFFSVIFRISIVPILIAICAVIYYGMSSVSFFSDFTQIGESTNLFSFSEIVLPAFAFGFSYLIAFALMTVASLSYIKSYIDHKGVVNYQEIQQLTKEKFWPYVGLFFLIAIMVFFGMIFCFIPGIYLGVVLSLSICFLVFQNKGVFDAIGDSFSLIKNHWWETFGVLLVVQLLIWVISFVISLPVTIYQGFDMVSALQNQDSTEMLNFFSDPIYLILLVFSYIVKFVLFIVSTISTVFIYYDIKEQKNPSSDIIDSIGTE
jgi:hypothetical protein